MLEREGYTSTDGNQLTLADEMASVAIEVLLPNDSADTQREMLWRFRCVMERHFGMGGYGYTFRQSDSDVFERIAERRTP